jgi:hypothetical protein
VRLARIRNTADTQFLEISAALVEEVRQDSSLTVAPAAHPLNLNCPVRPT